jgi:hypothetical protein
MSYSSLINDLTPYFYFPMDIKKDLLPVDVISDIQPFIEGDYGYDQQKRFYSNSLTLFEGSSFNIAESSEFDFSPATFGFWLDSDFVEDYTDIFSVHSGNTGIGMSYSKETNQITIHNYSGFGFVQDFEFDQPSLIVIEITPELSFEPMLTNSVDFKINSEIVHNQSNFLFPETPQITLGSLNDNQARGQISVSDFFYLQSTISQNNVENLYSLGYNGYEKLQIDSNSSIIVNDVNNDFLQTAWQSYGEITTKK